MNRFEPRFDDDCLVCGPTRVECKGGANKLCRKRDPRPSHLAGILDCYGCLRFVVAHRKTFKHHLRRDEILIAVPNTLVHEPIAWGDIPGLIAHIEWYVRKWIQASTPNEPHAQDAVRMYRLRCLEQNQGSLDLKSIVET
jgi:hypothetical protein